jgi:hypothetical protein
VKLVDCCRAVAEIEPGDRVARLFAGEDVVVARITSLTITTGSPANTAL